MQYIHYIIIHIRIVVILLSYKIFFFEILHAVFLSYTMTDHERANLQKVMYIKFLILL